MIDDKTKKKMNLLNKEYQYTQRKFEIVHAASELAQLFAKISDGNIDGYYDKVYTYEGGIDKFSRAFKENEMLSLDTFKCGEFYEHDYIFLLEDNSVLIANTTKDYNRSNGKYMCVKLNKIKIEDSFILGFYFTNLSGAGTDKAVIKKVYGFVDKDNYQIFCNCGFKVYLKYSECDILDANEGKDIREILTPVSIDTIINRIISGCSDISLEQNSIQRTRYKGDKNDRL